MEKLVQRRWSIYSCRLLTASPVQYLIIYGFDFSGIVQLLFYHHIGQRRLVHVVPDAGDALFEQRSLQVPPPGAHLVLGVIGKDACSRPDIANEESPVLVTTEVIVLQALLIHRIVFVNFRARINDRDQLHTLRTQVVDETRWIGKCSGIPGKVTISVHVVDIEPDRIAGMIAFTRDGSDLSNLLI